MTRGLAAATLVLLALARAASALSVDGIQTLVLGCFAPPGLAPHPDDPGVAFVACSEFPVGVFAIRISPGAPLALDPRFPPFFLPHDLNGSDPDPPTLPFIDDVTVERADLGWVTTTGYELVVPWDPGAGQGRPVRFEGRTRLSIPTSVRIEGVFTRTDGVEVTSFQTSFTSGVARVGDRLLVTTSNFARFGASPVLYPGTVLLFDLHEEAGGTIVASPAESPLVITTDPNPTALTVLPNGLVLVTNTGVLDLLDPPAPGGPGSLDVLDAGTGRILANLPLGESNPSFREVAVDPGGSIALVGSASFRELYAVDVRALDALPAPASDPTRQRPSCHGADRWEVSGVPCLWGRILAGPGGDLPPPIAIPGGAGSGRAGFVAEVRLQGEVGLATTFNAGRLAALAIDLEGLGSFAPILPDRLGEVSTAMITPPLDTPGAETGPGPMWVDPSGGSVVWVTNGPEGTVMRGSLSGMPARRIADSDGDGLPDAVDSCPRTPAATTGDLDADGVGDACDLCPADADPRSPRLAHETRRDGQRDDDGDGLGNVCDADLDGSGSVTAADLALLAGALGQLVTGTACSAPVPGPPASCAVYDLDETALVVSAGDLMRGLERMGAKSPGECPGCALPCTGPGCPGP